jgi:hypothetical protein
LSRTSPKLNLLLLSFSAALALDSFFFLKVLVLGVSEAILISFNR